MDKEKDNRNDWLIVCIVAIIILSIGCFFLSRRISDLEHEMKYHNHDQIKTFGTQFPLLPVNGGVLVPAEKK